MRRHPNQERSIVRCLALILLATNVIGLGFFLIGPDRIASAMAWLTKKADMPDPLDENVAAVLHPIERIAFSEDWRVHTSRKVKLGSYPFIILRTGVDSCAPISSNVQRIDYFVLAPTKIDVPSGKGGKTGTFHDALLPRNEATCSRSRFVFAEWKPETSGEVVFNLGGEQVRVDVQIEGLLLPPRRPMKIATTNSYLIRGHCIEYCKREGELAHKYAAVLVRHRIQPIQNWVGSPPVQNGVLNLDYRKRNGMSFRQTTMAYADGGYVGFPRMTGYKDKIAYLRALEATVEKENLKGRAWVYAVDEPAVNRQLVDHLKLYRIFAPSVKVMVTTPYDPGLDDVVDIFVPVFNRYVKQDAPPSGSRSKRSFWSYPSCMGSCGPNRKSDLNVEKKPGPDTELADFLIDRPADRLFQYFRELDKRNAGAGLYYEATEGYPLVRQGLNLIDDPWNFGGNGDGLLLYPGRPGEHGLSEHVPLASLRLKLIRHAIDTYW